MSLTSADRKLLACAIATIERRYRPEWHHVGAALRTRAGRIFTGVHLEAHVGRAAVCAEAVAIGTAATAEGDFGIETIVAVRHPDPGDPDRTIRVAAPCGICRELISDYDGEARVLIPDAGGRPIVRRISELLPAKFRRT
ncbi:MAG TPA: cytidine deaminase [Geminicoccaceae bacterium]